MKGNNADSENTEINEPLPSGRGAPDDPVSVFVIDRLYGENAKWLIVAIVMLGCTAIYFQTSSHAFINLDDNEYVYSNPYVLSGLSWENVKWAFSTFHAANWHPLTWISLETLSALFGPSAGAFHLANVALHIFNSVLLYFLLLRVSGSSWKSATVAAIFAFHPTHVESVAWIAEHKDVLSTALWLLTCWFYVSYTKDRRRQLNYFLTVLLFALGLMAKPMLVTLPFVFLLLDYWPLGRLDEIHWRRLGFLIVEKIPLFLLAAASSVLTFKAQKSGGAVVELANISLSDRISNAILSYEWYLGAFFIPVNLGAWYPFSSEAFRMWQVVLAALLLLGISLYVVYARRSGKYLLTGWFWFVGTLVPVIGLVQVGRQAHADRYTYIPYIGLGIALVWLAAEVVERYKISVNLVGAFAVVILFILGTLCFRQVEVWKNSESLYQTTLAVTSRNFIIEQNYCQFLIDVDRLDEAETQCRNSIADNEGYANGWNSLGIIQMKKGDFENAATDFEKASVLRPTNLEIFSNFISALIALGRLDEAEDKIDLVANSNTAYGVTAPYLFSLYRALGFAFAQKDINTKAINSLQKANDVNNNSDEIHKTLGLLLYESGKPEEALSQLDRSLSLNPNQADIQNAIGKIFLSQGKVDDAIRSFESALAIDPNMQAARGNLKAAMARK